MFFGKVVKGTALLLVAGILRARTGLIRSPAHRAVGGEQEAAPAKAPQALPAGAVRAGEVARAYLTNAALADERFTGKPTTVVGRVIRITREQAVAVEDGKTPTLYALEM